jgi:hypothetical protein
MATKVGSKVHPWYKGKHEWNVKKIAELDQPVTYRDDNQGEVSYNPKILLLENKNIGKVLWFAYWLSTDKTNHKFKWGQGPPMVEEDVFVDLIKSAIRQGFFSKHCMKEIDRQIQTAVS